MNLATPGGTILSSVCYFIYGFGCISVFVFWGALQITNNSKINSNFEIEYYQVDTFEVM